MPTDEKFKMVHELMRVLIRSAESVRQAPMRETERVFVYSLLDHAYGHAMNAEAILIDPDAAEMAGGYDFSDAWQEALSCFREARERMMEGIRVGLFKHDFIAGNVEHVPQVLRRYRNIRHHATPKEHRS